jgi:prepilin-type N-terminal cleavage/methylation domain-containing protein
LTEGGVTAITIQIMQGISRPSVGAGFRHTAKLHDNPAFTLVELLVVIAVIVILAAMVLPTFAGAKAKAVRIQCVSNQKQLIIAWALYALDNHDVLALNGGDTAVTSTQAHLWVYGGNHGDPETLTNSDYLLNPNYALFSPFIRSVQVYKCPADRSMWPLWNAPGKSAPESRSYSMNCYIGTPASGVVSPLSLNSSYRVYVKTSDLALDSPENRFVFVDVNPANICTPAFGVDMNLQDIIHYPSDLHRNVGVLTFADSHVETHKWVDPRTLVGLPPGQQYLPHGILSINNKDLAWIAQRTTSKK